MISKKELEARLVELCKRTQEAIEMYQDEEDEELFARGYNSYLCISKKMDEYEYILTGKLYPSVWEVYNECEYDAKEYYGKLAKSYYDDALAYAKETHQPCELYMKNGKYYKRAI